MKKAFFSFELSDLDYQHESSRIEKLISDNSPKDIGKSNKTRETLGMFGFFRGKQNFGGHYYHKQFKTVSDPYTNEPLEVPQVKVTSFIYVKVNDNNLKSMLFISGSNQSEYVLNLLNIDLQKRKTVTFDPDYIEYLNNSEESWQCYSSVLNGMSSREREGSGEDGHMMREKYDDLDQRDTVQKTRFRHYAKVKMGLSSGVHEVTLNTDGKMSFNHYIGELSSFGIVLEEAYSRIKFSYQAFLDCPNKSG